MTKKYLEQKIHIMVEARKSFLNILIVLAGGISGLILSILSDLELTSLLFGKIFLLIIGILFGLNIISSLYELKKSLTDTLNKLKEFK